jgi:hypothetical protein
MLYGAIYSRLATVLIFLTNLLYINITFAQNINTEKFQYISPVPSSKLNNAETNIIIRFRNAFDQSVLNKNSALSVTGSKSINHTGKITLAERGKTLLFNPDKQFADGEKVIVKLNEGLKTASGEEIPTLQYFFETSKINLNRMVKTNPEKYTKLLNPDLYNYENQVSEVRSHQNKSLPKSYSLQKDSLPSDFPKIIVNVNNNPSPGFLFFSPFVFPASRPTYNIITDNYGIPVYYKKMHRGRTYDFKKQTTGVLSYFENGPNQHYILDSFYNIIDSLQMQNGYTTDVHELVITDSGYAFLQSFDYVHVGMDTVVEGGDPNATVIALVIQELDLNDNKKMVFQWRSLDHIPITDATFDIDLTGATIDYIHGNTIEPDFDGNLLISSRHLDEVTKIDRETGDIIWRWGGEYCKNNKFKFIKDPIGFSHQHDVRRLPNGNITLFDNGNLHDPQFSRAVEYHLDEANKTAELVWEFENNPSTYTYFMGSTRRVSNQNTIIGWGNWTKPAISEVNINGSVELQISFPDTIINYRAFKFPWKTNLFVTYPDSLSFGSVSIGDSVVKSLTIKNNSNQEIEINGLLNRNSSYITNVSLPLVIPGLSSDTIQVIFRPETGGDQTDDLYLQWNKAGERISQVVPMIGAPDSNFNSVDDNQNKIDYSLAQNYPNPFNSSTKISFTLPERGKVSLKIYDMLGRKVKTLINRMMSSGIHGINFNAKSLPSGVYFYSLKVNNYTETKKMILLR